MKKTVLPWLKRADEDLYMISVLDISLAPNGVAFLAQQAVEKYLKACWVELGSIPPMTHDLEELWVGVENQVKLDIDLKSLMRLAPFGTSGRYPKLEVNEEKSRWAVEFCLEVCSKLKVWLEQ